jgi:apolipoprotein N-acyltransferase
MRINQNHPKPLWAFLPAALLLLATGHMPGAYDQFVHIVVCGCALVILAQNHREHHALNVWGYCFILIAILFNPIVPFHLDRGMWFCMYAIAAPCFIGYAIRFGAHRDAPIAVCAAPQG